MFNKRGMSHVDWAISMGVFITGMLALFLLWQPWSQQDNWEGDFLTKIVMDNLLYGPDDGGYNIKGNPICGDSAEDKYCITSVFYRKRVYVDDMNTAYSVSLASVGLDRFTDSDAPYILIKDKEDKKGSFGIDGLDLYLKGASSGKGYLEIYYDSNKKVSLSGTSTLNSGSTTGIIIGTGVVEFSGLSIEGLGKVVYGLKSDKSLDSNSKKFRDTYDNPSPGGYQSIKQQWNYPAGREFQICLRDNRGNVYNTLAELIGQSATGNNLYQLKLKKDTTTVKCTSTNSITKNQPPSNVEIFVFDMPLRLIGDDPSYDPNGFVKDKDGNKLETIYVSVSAW